MYSVPPLVDCDDIGGSDKEEFIVLFITVKCVICHLIWLSVPVV